MGLKRVFAGCSRVVSVLFRVVPWLVLFRGSWCSVARVVPWLLADDEENGWTGPNLCGRGRLRGGRRVDALWAWNPPLATYLDYVPIGAVFAAFCWDRFFPRPPLGRLLLSDIVVVMLALMRVFVPPLPFLSGHALFAGYSALTARRWPLTLLALALLVHVIYIKVFVTGGVISMLGGLTVAAVLAVARNRQHV
jgi:hypothetical protein